MPEQTKPCYRCHQAFGPLLQTLLCTLPTEQSLSKLSHRKCEWSLFCHMLHHLKQHKTLLFHKTDHSIEKKKKVRMRNPRMLFPFTTLPLLGHMKRDFYLANEVLKKIYTYKDIIK